MRFLDLFLHIKLWYQLRVWMKGRWTTRLRTLTWYGLPLTYTLSWKGLVRVLGWNLFSREVDENAADFGVVNLYFAQPGHDGSARPAPTIWHCPALTARAWWDQSSAEVCRLESTARMVIAEYLSLRKRMDQHPNSDALSGAWKAGMLYQTQGRKNEALCRLCPETTALVDSLPLCPNFGFVMFSELAGPSQIEAHTGSSNLRLRHHLGLVVPDSEDCFLTVAGESRRWQEGEALVFDDAYMHSVHQGAEESRAVLIVDLWHPDLTSTERETLGHSLFSDFGKGRAPSVWRALLYQHWVRPLVLLKRHCRNWTSFFSDRGRHQVRAQLRELFHLCTDFFEEIDVAYFLDCGTLLGQFRDEDIILGDTDLDFGLFDSDFEKVWQNRDRLPSGVKIHDTSFRHNQRKLYLEHGGWEADLIFYEDWGDCLCWSSPVDYPTYSEPVSKSVLLPLRSAPFLGKTTSLPNDTEVYLQQRFAYLGHDAKQDPISGKFRQR